MSGKNNIQLKSVPAVPKSYALREVTKPSYTTPLENDKNSNGRTVPLYSNIPPISKSSGIPGKGKSGVVYSNIDHGHSSTDAHIYNNVNTYSNIPPFASRRPIEELPPPPPELEDYGEGAFPDALPAPPSPVSSSYSELRRATQFGASNYPDEYGHYQGPSSRSSSTYESIYEPINVRPPSEMSSRSNYSLYTSASALAAPPNSSEPESEVDALTDLLVQSMDSVSTAGSDTFGECCQCGERVVNEGSGCTAMGKVYHIACFTCCHCDMQLQGNPFYNVEGQPYCEEGYLETLEKCSICCTPILDRILRATGRPYHPHCFTCVVCGKSLDGIPFTIDATNQIHCIEDFHQKFAPRCCVCKDPIMAEPGEDETVRVVALDRSFHVGCYKCEDCGLLLSSELEDRSCYPLDNHVLCKSCNAKRVQALTSIMTTEL